MIIALEEAKHSLLALRDDLADLGSALRIEECRKTAEELDEKTLEESFWSDQKEARKFYSS